MLSHDYLLRREPRADVHVEASLVFTDRELGFLPSSNKKLVIAGGNLLGGRNCRQQKLLVLYRPVGGNVSAAPIF
jgi:hypothetical protein